MLICIVWLYLLMSVSKRVSLLILWTDFRSLLMLCCVHTDCCWWWISPIKFMIQPHNNQEEFKKKEIHEWWKNNFWYWLSAGCVLNCLCSAYSSLVSYLTCTLRTLIIYHFNHLLVKESKINTGRETNMLSLFANNSEKYNL